MTSSGLALRAGVVLALLGEISPCAAEAAEETTEPAPPLIAAIDFDTIPKGALPPVPGDAEPSGAMSDEPRAQGLKMEKVKLPPRRKKKPSPGLAAKMGKSDVVELAPDHPEIGALYVPSVDGTDFGGDPVRMTCRREAAPSFVRWETLTVAPGGDAQLEIKDLKFDPGTCTAVEGPTTRVALKAIARDKDRPWLFAVRDDNTVTFLLPRTDDVSADAMVGSAVTVRGGFTRVSLPIARWGSSSFVAHVPSLELRPPPPPAPRAKGRAPSVRGDSKPDEEPTEVTVELVQTMSEKSPTLLVRRSQPASDAPQASAAD